MQRKDDNLWAAVVVDTMDDATATMRRVAGIAETRRGPVVGGLRSDRTRLTWRASLAARHLLPHRYVPRRVVLWHTGPGGGHRMEIRSDYCRCGARVTENRESGPRQD